MAAGQGFKTFTTGEVLTAGDVNGYLMQGINVFASEAARDAAITAPAEGQFAYTKDNNSLWYYTGAAWAASGATGDIEGVTVTSPLTGGGTSGTVTVGILNGTTSNLGAVQLSDSTSSTSTTLAATANAVKTSYDLAAAAIPKSTVTTAGDVIYATGSSAVTRLGIGSTGQVLTVAGGVPSWATASAPAFVGAAAYNSNFTLNMTGGTAQAIPYTSEDFDTDSFHSTSSNTSRFTIPTGKGGKYLLSAFFEVNTTANMYLISYFRKNGNTTINGFNRGFCGDTDTNSGFKGWVGEAVVDTVAGDYWEFIYQQGQTLTMSACYSRFQITYLGA